MKTIIGRAMTIAVVAALIYPAVAAAHAQPYERDMRSRHKVVSVYDIKHPSRAATARHIHHHRRVPVRVHRVYSHYHRPIASHAYCRDFRR